MTTRDAATTVVVKIGGSLLDLPNLAERIAELPATLGAPCQMVVGGGAAADVVRSLHRCHRLSEATSHELAIGAMDLNAEFLRRLLDESTESVGGLAVVPIRERLRELSQPLPSVWAVTSDSIAAAIATAGGHRLVLAKSIPPPQSIGVAVARGQVDSYFPTAAAGLDVDWLNLRTPHPIAVRLAN